jgi:hypothetical protein
MGLYDHPIIDEASKHSEDSELEMRIFIRQSAGFICRPVNPDTGCDFRVELIIDEAGAGGVYFDIQLKSQGKITVSKSGEYITYSFEASRLGYLARSQPLQGIVVLYSVEKKKCYFEFVSEILIPFIALPDNRWEKQGHLTIKIPIKNELNERTASQIHHYYRERSTSVEKLLQAFGPIYGLPATRLEGPDKEYDLNNPNHIVAFLEKQGTNLLIEYNVSAVANLLKKLTESQIYSSTKIICMAAAINSEEGKFDLSEVQCSRALKRNDISEDDKILILHARLKNRYLQERISITELIQELESFKELPLSEQSRINLDINLTYFRIKSIPSGVDISAQYYEDIFALFSRIEESSLSDRVKLLMRLWNFDNFSEYIIAVFFHEASITLQPGSPTRMVVFLQEIARLTTQFGEILENLRGKEAGEKNRLIRAYTLQTWVKHHLNLDLTLAKLKPYQNNFAGFPESLVQFVNQALTSHEYFLQEGFVYEAYNSLCYGLELIEIGKRRLQKTFHHDPESLFAFKKKMEEEISIQPYQLQVPLFYPETDSSAPKNNLNPQQLSHLAAMIGQAHQMPILLAEHAFAQAAAYREFYSRSTNPDLDLVSIYSAKIQGKPSFSMPVYYQLRNRVTGLVSTTKLDINVLLADWGL